MTEPKFPSSLGLSALHRASLANRFSGRDGDLLKSERDGLAELASSDTGIDAQPSPTLPKPASVDRLYDPRKVQLLPTLVREELHHNKTTWRKLYMEHGVKELAEVVMQEEIEARLTEKKALFVRDTEWSAYVMQQILLSTDRILIESIMFGNLAKDRRLNPSLATALAELKRQSQHQPGIYYQSLVDEHGESPSARELGIICNCIIDYLIGSRQAEAQGLTGAIDDVLANKIDNFQQDMESQVPLTESAKGYRKYMNTRPQVEVDPSDNPYTRARKKGTSAPTTKKTIERFSPAHFKETLHLVEMLRNRLTSVSPTDRDKPLQFPLVEIGYSKRCVNRLEKHAPHSGSNYLMNLTESICSALQMDFGRLYTIEQVVIYLIWLPEQAEIAEIGFTKLAEGYTHNAGGFSHFPAGLSNHSANTIPARDWNLAKKYLVERSVYPANLHMSMAKLERQVVLAEEKAAAQKQQEHGAEIEAASTALKKLTLWAASKSDGDREAEVWKEQASRTLASLKDRTNDGNKLLLDVTEKSQGLAEKLSKMRAGMRAARSMTKTIAAATGASVEEPLRDDVLDAVEELVDMPKPSFQKKSITVMTRTGRKRLDMDSETF